MWVVVKVDLMTRGDTNMKDMNSINRIVADSPLETRDNLDNIWEKLDQVNTTGSFTGDDFIYMKCEIDDKTGKLIKYVPDFISANVQGVARHIRVKSSSRKNWINWLYDLNDKEEKSITVSPPLDIAPKNKIDIASLVIKKLSEELNTIKDKQLAEFETLKENLTREIEKSESEVVDVRYLRIDNEDSKFITQQVTEKQTKLKNLETKLKSLKDSINEIDENKKKVEINVDKMLAGYSEFSTNACDMSGKMWRYIKEREEEEERKNKEQSKVLTKKTPTKKKKLKFNVSSLFMNLWNFMNTASPERPSDDHRKVVSRVNLQIQNEEVQQKEAEEAQNVSNFLSGIYSVYAVLKEASKKDSGDVMEFLGNEDNKSILDAASRSLSELTKRIEEDEENSFQVGRPEI